MTRRRLLLQIAQRLPVPRARQVLALVCAMGAIDFAQQAATAWEEDMQPVCSALIAVLKSNNRRRGASFARASPSCSGRGTLNRPSQPSCSMSC